MVEVEQPAAPDEVTTVLPSQPSSASTARQIVGVACRSWHLEGLVDDLALVATELVANAIRHAGTDMILRLIRIEDGVRLEVRDGSTRPLRPRPPTSTEENGRGLILVDALSHRYGVEAEPQGKRVWAELVLD